MIIPSRRQPLLLAVGIAAASWGVVASIFYARLGLTLTHYDARGHLVVARRIIDSITPGWQQIGAVWLPLPHILNAFPVQLDHFYRTGASAVAISVVAFAVATISTAWIVDALTSSKLAAIAAAAVFALNPNVLYLQSTPMTEPLLLALTMAAVAMLIESIESSDVNPLMVGGVFALACLTRYEAWPITACALLAAVWARWRRGDTWRMACRQIAQIAVYPMAVWIGFAVFSRIVVGRWFVGSDFFVPENDARGNPMLALDQIIWGVKTLSGSGLLAVGAAGAALLLLAGLFSRRRSEMLVALSLVAAAALPWSAFVEGHPFRIRYMIPLIGIEAVGTGVLAAVAARRRFGSAPAILLIALVAFELRPLAGDAPMVVEAKWDQPNIVARQRVTDCLRTGYDGESIMASMGSLGHYMQDLSRAGFEVRDFLHEGNGDIWLAALEHPRPYVGWILIEEKAEGGDLLARRARRNPQFLDGFSRLCDAAGVALYRRAPVAGTLNPN